MCCKLCPARWWRTGRAPARSVGSSCGLNNVAVTGCEERATGCSEFPHRSMATYEPMQEISMLIQPAPPMVTLEVAGGPKTYVSRKTAAGHVAMAPISLVPHVVEMHKDRQNFASKFDHFWLGFGAKQYQIRIPCGILLLICHFLFRRVIF